MIGKRFISAGLALLVATAAARAHEEYDKLFKEFQEAQQTWFAAYAQAQKEAGEDNDVDLTKLPAAPEKEFRPRFQALADKNAGKPAAVAPLVWLISTDRAQPGRASEGSKKALKALTKSHAADRELGDHLEQLSYASYAIGREPLMEFYEKVIAENKDKPTIARAKFSLGLTLQQGWAGEGKASGPRERAIQLFREVAKDYADTPAGKDAEGYVFELDNLQVGMKAPDFEGQDADGKTIKLSQYKGRVVVLDFWGFW